jgi:hypothetical protein
MQVAEIPADFRKMIQGSQGVGVVVAEGPPAAGQALARGTVAGRDQAARSRTTLR